MEAYRKVIRCTDIMKIIFSMQSGRAFKDWIDGDLAAKLGYLYIIKENPRLIFTARSFTSAITHGYYDIVDWLSKNKRMYTFGSLNTAIDTDDLKMVELVYKVCKNFSVGMVDTAAGKNNVELVKWLVQRTKERCALHYATRSGNIKLITYLLKKKFTLSKYSANDAILSNVEFVEWFKQNGYFNNARIVMCGTPEIMAVVPRECITGECMDSALPNIELCKSLSLIKKCDRTIMIKAIQTKDLDFVKWVDENYGVEDAHLISACKYGTPEIVDYLLSRGCTILRIVERAVQGDNIPVVTHLLRRFPPMGAKREAARTGNIELFQILERYDDSLSWVFFSEAAYGGDSRNIPLLKYMITQNYEIQLRMCEDGIINAVRHDDIEFIKFMYSIGCCLPEAIKTATDYMRINILEFLIHKHHPKYNPTKIRKLMIKHMFKPSRF